MSKKMLIAASAALTCMQAAWADSDKYFFMLVPPNNSDWLESVPMISTDGGKTGKPMSVAADMCGWFTYKFNMSDLTDNVVIYRDNDTAREDMIGFNGNWESNPEHPQPIALSTFFDAGYDTLFFVPDETIKTNDDGLYFNKSEVSEMEGVCSYNMAAIIYDSDASLHPAFSCYSAGGEGCQQGAQGVSLSDAMQAINACIGVTSGVVESTLDSRTKKPKLSSAGKKCFINDTLFSQLFAHTEGVNEKTCFDIPFHRSNDGMWEFNSDFYTSPGTSVQGGFYPVELTTDESVSIADPVQTPVAAARTKRTAEGPIFYGPALRAIDQNEGAAVIDLACNGPAWNKGHDCEGVFADGEATTEFFQNIDPSITCVMGWNCAEDAPEGWQFYKDGSETVVSATTAGAVNRWTSQEKADGTGGRNQHFCMESHSTFTYKPGLKFTFNGADDLWVFVDNKLAVDLGGTHLTAPSYVDLDSFKGVSGSLVAGKVYDLDIFYCDRRTTMNGLRIKTNAFAKARATAITAVNYKDLANKNLTTFKLCYYASAAGSCGMEEVLVCDTTSYKSKISYTLVKGNDLSSPAVEGLKDVTTPGVYMCGIDLTNLMQPVVDKNNLCLTDGLYSLYVTINGDSKRIAKFRLGSVESIKTPKPVVKSFNAYTEGNSIAIAADRNSNASYVVLNAFGSVVRKGNLLQGHAVVPSLASGSYIVKVGVENRRVNVR